MSDHNLPDGGTLALTFKDAPGRVPAILRAISPLRPRFIFERISTRSRSPERTYIGVGGTVLTPSFGDGDAFETVRRALAERSGSRSSPRAILAFLSYEELVGASPASDAGASAPRHLLIAPSFLSELDHAAGVATLSGGYQAAVAGVRDALSAGLDVEPRKPRDGNEGVDSWQSNQSEDAFVSAASALQREIAARADIAGAALSVELERTASLDPLEAYLVLRDLNPSTCMFFLENREFALWGSTSLPILKIRGRRLTAETDGATRKVDPATSDVWIPNEKENQEYDLVVAALQSDLEGVVDSTSLVFVADREPRQYFNLQHLFAEISGDLASGVDAVTALKRLTPHGAATGYGKSAAIELIRRFDASPRGPYAGAIGVFGVDGSADAACVIRSAWKIGSTIRTRAGAKIVAGSDPAAEYRESVLKTLPLRRSIGQLISS